VGGQELDCLETVLYVGLEMQEWDELQGRDLLAASPTTAQEPLGPAAREFYEAISRIDPRLAEIYLGAELVLLNPANPDRYAQAAHSIREFIEIAQKTFAGLENATVSDVFEKLRELIAKWGTLATNRITGGDSFEPEDIPVVKEFLASWDEFQEWFSGERLSKSQARKMATEVTLLPYSSFGSPTRESVNKLFGEMERYFINLAHHNVDYRPDEFKWWIDFFRLYYGSVAPAASCSVDDGRHNETDK